MYFEVLITKNNEVKSLVNNYIELIREIRGYHGLDFSKAFILDKERIKIHNNILSKLGCEFCTCHMNKNRPHRPCIRACLNDYVETVLEN